MSRPTGSRLSDTRRNLRLSTRDGSWYCVMWAVGESSIGAFGVALGLSAAVVGFLDSVPKVCGSLMQLASHRVVRMLGSHKRWVVWTALVQALTFLPLAIGGLLGDMPATLLFLFAAIYWGAAWACANTWTTFISTIVPRSVRPAFFSQRNRWLNLVIVLSMLIGGWVLAAGRAAGHEFGAFASLFAIACACRLLSALYLHRHTEPQPIPPGLRAVSWRELFGRYRHGPGGRFLAYRLGHELANQVSTPFLVPFLLRERGLQDNYFLFAALAATPILSKALILPLLGRIAHGHGSRALLRLGGLAVVPLPLLWLVDESIEWMFIVQIITGVALGAQELAVFLLAFDTIPENERTSVMSKFNVGLFIMTLLGSLIGGALLIEQPAREASSHAQVGYTLAFATSAVLRMASLALLARIPKLETLPSPDVGEELPPLSGTLEQPVIPLHDAKSPEQGVDSDDPHKNR